MEKPSKEELEDYELQVKVHKKHVENYRFFLDRIVNHLDSNSLYSTKAIKEIMTAEIDRVQSMDAPNKPGYYRANND